jgi:hypothetical protein
VGGRGFVAAADAPLTRGCPFVGQGGGVEVGMLAGPA